MPVAPSKPGQPVVGFNHNLSYKGRTFHVQTEDSGPQHGHVITHVFLGGNILASTKSSYAELVELAPGDLAGQVRRRMEDQHKAMIKGLIGGKHDAEITRRMGDGVYEPGVLAGGERAPGLLVGGEKPAPKASSPNPTPPVVAPVAPPVAPPTPPTRAASKPMASSLPAAKPAANGRAARAPTLDEILLAFLAADLDERG